MGLKKSKRNHLRIRFSSTCKPAFKTFLVYDSLKKKAVSRIG